MDKIWVRNPSKSEVIGRCGGDENTEWPRRTDKSRMLKKQKKTPTIWLSDHYCFLDKINEAIVIVMLKTPDQFVRNIDSDDYVT